MERYASTSHDENISGETIIRNDVLKKIIDHHLQPGDKVPSENTLSDAFGAKRIDARNALTQLEKMGFLESRHGIGRFTKQKAPTIELDISGRKSFSEKMKEDRLPYESKVIQADYANTAEFARYQDVLGCKNDERIFKFARLRIVHHIPCAIHISFIRESHVPGIYNDKDNIQSMFNYFKEAGYHNLMSTDSVISTAFPTMEEQEMLSCNELVPLIIYETDTFDEVEDKRLEAVRILYRSDLFKHRLSQ